MEMTLALALCLIWLTVLAGLVALPDLEQKTTAIFVFFVSTGLSLGIYNTAGLVAPDAIGYHYSAYHMASYWAGAEGVPANLDLGKEGWPIVLAAAYYLLVPSPTIGCVINAAFLALTTACVWRIALIVTKSRRLATAAGLLMLTPTVQYWGALLLREAGMWFFLSAMVLGILKFKNRDGSSFLSALLIALGAIGSYAFRSSIAILLIALVVLMMVLARGVPVWVKSTTIVAVGLVSPFAYAYLNDSQLIDPERIQLSQQELAASSSGFETIGSPGSISQFARVALGPFPWELPALPAIYAVDWIAWIVVFLVSLWGILRRSCPLVVYVPPAAILFALALTSGNYGTMVRLRISAFVLLIPVFLSAFRVRSRKGGEEDVQVELA